MADAMLGKLARWLRIIGYDTRYDPSLHDDLLLNISRREARLLLTRDVELFRRAQREGINSVLIKSDLLPGELEEISKLLKGEKGVSRCPVCNGPLLEVERSSFEGVSMPREGPLWRCQSCGKAYWHGSHWRGINRTLSKLGLCDPIDYT
jgi:hypothetical protein